LNAVAKIVADSTGAEPTTESGLALLRAPFPDNLISKLPKETKKQAEQRKADQDKGNWPAKCDVCGGLHHPRAVHLDYVGHAALTHRLLDADPNWSWEPLAFRDGLPAFDNTGGLWIKLSVCGVTRLGYGHAAAKPGMDPGAREKEVIGDALRNAAMRFGAALDLWHKGDLHAPADDSQDDEAPTNNRRMAAAVDMAINLLKGCGSSDMFREAWTKNFEGWKQIMDPADYAKVQAVKAEMVKKFQAEAEEAKRREAAQSRTSKPVEDFGIPDDEIPF
jgi:hypothetical protein